MKKILTNQKGQAVFELIIFLPFIIFLYSIYYTLGNSINGSINQQKAVRGYFYSLTMGNSYVSNLVDLVDLQNRGIKGVGFSSLGWRWKTAGTDGAYGGCFKFISILKNASTENCIEKPTEVDGDGYPMSRFIRVFTYYGVCGPFYVEDDRTKQMYINPRQQNTLGGCALLASPPGT